MRPQIVKILSPVCCLLTAIPMFSQGPSSSEGPPPPNRMPSPDPFPELPLPIDDNIVFLLIAAMAIGLYVAVKKMRATGSLQ